MGPIFKSSEIPFLACKFAYISYSEKRTIAKDFNTMLDGFYSVVTKQWLFMNS